MPNQKFDFTNRASSPPSGVERACAVAKQIFNHARGNHATDRQTITEIAERARLTPATVKSLLYPSLRPKDVSLDVWARLVRAYRRYLNQRLNELHVEIARLEALDPADGAIRDLLDEAKALVLKIEAVAPPPGDDARSP